MKFFILGKDQVRIYNNIEKLWWKGGIIVLFSEDRCRVLCYVAIIIRGV